MITGALFSLDDLVFNVTKIYNIWELFVNKLNFQGKCVFKTIFQTTCSRVCCHTQKVPLWQHKKTLIKKEIGVFLFLCYTRFWEAGAVRLGSNTTFQKKSVILFELFTKINTNHACFPYAQKISLWHNKKTLKEKNIMQF